MAGVMATCGAGNALKTWFSEIFDNSSRECQPDILVKWNWQMVFFFIFITTPEGHVRVHIVAKINLISVRHRIISTNPPYVLARSFAQLLSTLTCASFQVQELWPSLASSNASLSTWWRRRFRSQYQVSAKSFSVSVLTYMGSVITVM